MDKYEYKIKVEEIKELIAQKRYAEAMAIADGIDWRKVRSVIMLCTISDLYKKNRKYEESKELLLLAYERNPNGRMIVYSLCELCIKMENPVEAIEYYKEFIQIAPKDSGKYILQYKLYESQEVSLEERIAVLEEFKKKEYRPKWAYELAYLYHRVGLSTRCVEECDQLILWFGEGRFVAKAMELKMLHQPLTEEQEIKYALATGKILQQPAKPQEMPQNIGDTIPAPVRLKKKSDIADIAADIAPKEAYVQPDKAPYMENAQAPQEEELDIRVRPVNVGEYATINLQRELAKSMQDIFPQEAKEEAVLEEAALQEAALEETALGETVLEKPALAQPEPDSEEIFFAEKDTAEIRIEPASQPEPESAFNKILSQEYDGQLRIVVPETGAVERQITGQMNIHDILNEWERMKKETGQKQEEDLKQKIQQQADAMFTEFDVASRTGVLAQLEEIEESANEAIARIVDYSKLSAKKEPEELSKAPAAEDTQEIVQEASKAAKLEEAEAETETKEESEEEDVPSATEMYTKQLLFEDADEETKAPTIELPRLQTSESAIGRSKKARTLTDDEKELFASFMQTKEMKEQLMKAIDTISLAAYTGNVIITGEEGAGTIDLAKNLIKEIRQTDSNFSGKIARIAAELLNEKDIVHTLDKLANGALIVEKASALKPEMVKKLGRALEQDKNGVIIILEDCRKDMDSLLEKNPAILEHFNARIDIEALDNDALVAYGKKYAESREYSIDEMGVLALYTRIADMQTSDYTATVSDVKELIDGAIRHAGRKTMKHFMDVLLAKRYDRDDRIILREEDF